VREVRWERMFPDELEQAFVAHPLVYFTYGLCEPHGPHNTLGLDALNSHGLACAAARGDGGIVAPPDYWHIHGYGPFAAWGRRMVGEPQRAWLTAVPPWMFFRQVLYHLRTADLLGFHAAIFLIGHLGPHAPDFARLIDMVQPYVGTRLWCPRPAMPYVLPDAGARVPVDHAGQLETSVLWALEPDCVDVSRLPSPGTPLPQFGMSASAHQADRLLGENIVAASARALGSKGHELLAAYAGLQPRHTLRTHADVEALWETVVRPRLQEFACMQEPGGDPPPPDSVWHEHWKLPVEGAVSQP